MGNFAPVGGSHFPLSLPNCHPTRKRMRRLQTCFQMGPSLHLIVLICILIFLLYAHVRSNQVQERVVRYHLEESALVLHLQQIERHSTTLHKEIQRRLRKAGLEDAVAAIEPVQLKAMSERLHSHVVDLQRTIQEDARSNIIQRFGEGPLKLVLDLKFAGEEGKGGHSKSQLDILFWTSTPHATWTLLEQVGRKIWDGAVFEWGLQQKILQVTPVNDDPEQRGRLEFSEDIPEQEHSPWTVGIRDDPDTGKLQLFLNLHDNAESHDHETCIGRVVGGFDVLQRLILAVRQHPEGGPAVIIRQASAVHVTTK